VAGRFFLYHSLLIYLEQWRPDADHSFHTAHLEYPAGAARPAPPLGEKIVIC